MHFLLLYSIAALALYQPLHGLILPPADKLIALVQHDTDKTPALGTASFEQQRSMQNTIEQELSAIGLGNVEFAYQNYLTRDFQRQTSLEIFRKFIDQYGDLWDQAHFDYKKIPIHEDRVAVVKGTLSSSYSITYFMKEEDDEWKILGIEVLPRD